VEDFYLVSIICYNFLNQTLAIEIDDGVTVYDLHLEILRSMDGISLTCGKCRINIKIKGVLKYTA
jgi:hypothetical protein